jgi:quercetin dioxygenase-like cupin family protein
MFDSFWRRFLALAAEFIEVLLNACYLAQLSLHLCRTFSFHRRLLLNQSRRALLQRGAVAAPLFISEVFSPLTASAQAPAPPEQWYWYPGHSLTMKAIAKDTAATCTWMLVENSPQQGVPFHKHLREDESFYVINGLFEITVGDETVTGGPGTYIYGPRGVPHRWTNMGSARGRMLNVFTPSGLEQYFLSVALPISSSSQQPSVDTATLVPKMAALRDKFGLIRTGSTKYPPSLGQGL